MNTTWNINNRGRRGWNGPRRDGRGRAGYRGSWPQNIFRGHNVPFQNRPRRYIGGDRFRGKPQKSRHTYTVLSQRLTEQEIGVTEYISDHKGFNGIIKCRYSDFQVSEINEQGEVAKLTCLAPPKPPVTETVKEDDDQLFSKYNLELLDMETWDKINQMALSKQPTADVVEVDVTGMSKEQRTKIHEAVKKAFGRNIVGSTITKDDKKFVKFERFRKGVRIDKRVKWIWPGEYVYFMVHKENCDTMEAATRLAEKLKVSVKSTLMGYAGNKDRRAKTTQWFSLRKVDPRRISSAAYDLKDIYIGNYSFSKDNLKLGMLKGNKFRIALRNVTAPDEVISKACENLKERGFINYYGLQRFGTRIETPTYEIGRKLLQNKYQEAINYILEDHELSFGPNKRAVGGAERMQRALFTNPKDKVGALAKLARNQRLLYLHAYQSLIWNRCVSRRLQLYGAKPAVGDLVPLVRIQNMEDQVDDGENDEEQDDGDNHDEEDVQNSKEVETDTNKELIVEDNEEKEGIESATDKNAEPAKDSDEKPPESNKKGDTNRPEPKIPVKVLTQEDIDSELYTIFDIIMPLPGYNIDYPPNMVDYFKELLEGDNLKLDLIHKNKAYSLSGTYRHVVIRPSDVEWRCVRYDSPYCDLQVSDLQEMRGQTATGVVDDGQYKALLLTLTLPASSYATMALRELLRVDTSCDNQAQQNNYHKNTPDEESESKRDEQENVEKERSGEKRKVEESADEAVDAKKQKQEETEGASTNAEDNIEENCDDSLSEHMDSKE